MPIARRSLLATAVGGVAAAVLAACGDDESGGDNGVVILKPDSVPADGPSIVLRPDRSPGGRLVALVGDSITVGSTPQLETAAEAANVELVINAEVGRRLTSGRSPKAGVTAIADVIREHGEPDLWMIALGTNDVGHYNSDDEYAAQIDDVLAMIPAATPLVWINVYLTNYPDESAQFNGVLDDRIEARGNDRVGKWTSFATDDGVLSDGIHPSEDGKERFATLVVDEIRSLLG